MNVQDAINHKKSPVCVFQEPDIIERTVRDFLTEDVERIVVDSKAAYQRIQETIGRISPRSVKRSNGIRTPRPSSIVLASVGNCNRRLTPVNLRAVTS